VKRRELRGALLASSSALALIAIASQGANAGGTCTSIASVPYSNAGAIGCILFNGVTGPGSITNSGAITAPTPGNVFPTYAGIALSGGTSLTNGGITNNGSISSQQFGIFVNARSTVTGPIVNAAGGVITGGDNAIFVDGNGSLPPATNVGAITNNGTLNGGIAENGVTSNGDIANNGTIVFTAGGANAGAVIAIGAGVLNGNIVNNGSLISAYTGAIWFADGGIINGSITNNGTITNNDPYGAGIWVLSGGNYPGGNTITGSIVNSASGKIAGGFGIQVLSTSSALPATVQGNIRNAGTIAAGYSGINVGSATVDGAVSNSGTITAGRNGIQLINLASTPGGSVLGTGGAATVKGGVINSGTITSTGAGYAGIDLDGGVVTTGIANSATGTIAATNGAGILLSNTGKFLFSAGTAFTSSGGPSSVKGGISNQGTIVAKTGIMVTGGSTVDAISNSGTITASRAAIDVSGEGAATTINQQGGTINGAILLSTLGDTVNVSGGAINGNITGQAFTGTVNFGLGTGTFAYSDAITNVSAINVNSGALYDNGTISATNLNVNGNGVLAPGLPGGTVGTLIVTGNLTFAPSASYRVTLNGFNASLTSVTGAATLGGATVQLASGSQFAFGRTYEILTATGGLTGAFNPNVTYYSVDASVSYGNSTNVYLTLAPSALASFLPAGSGGNDLNVARVLDSYANSGSILPAGFQALYSLSPPQLQVALTQLSGETATGTLQTTFDAVNLFMGVMTDPFSAGHGGSAPGGGVSFYADPRDANAMFTKAMPVKADPFTPRWSVWASGFGGSQTTDGNAAVGSNTTSSSVYGTAVGADYLLSPNTVAGFALAGGGTNFSVANGGSGRSDLFQAGGFIRHTVGQAYIASALAYAWQDVTTNRTVTFPGFDQLQARFNANAYSGRLEGGYRFVAPWIGGVGLIPYASGQFTTYALPAYAESTISGASGLALAYSAANVTDARSELGLRADKRYALADAVLTLRGRAAWAYDFDPNRNVSATFQSLPGASFVVNGAAQARDNALTTASAELKWMNGWSVAGTFEGEFSDVTRSYAGKGIVRYQW